MTGILGPNVDAEIHDNDAHCSDIPESLNPENSTAPLEKDSICIDFHPHSGKPTETYTFDEYSQTFDDDSPPPPIPEENVFRPFQSRGDFEFADLALDASLSNGQIDAFLKLIHDVASGVRNVTLKDHTDLSKTWELASHLKTHVSLLNLPDILLILTYLSVDQGRYPCRIYQN